MRSAVSSMPPRSWRIDDLLDLGEKEGVTYLKAIPILMLERWLQGGKKDGAANYVWTKELAKRLVSSGLTRPFKPKGTSNILGALGAIQAARNLVDPPLVKYKRPGMSWVNLPHYESLLEEYRQEYRLHYPTNYKKLFKEGEPNWELTSPAIKPKGITASSVNPEPHNELRDLLAPIERALLERQRAITKLEESNIELQAELLACRTALQNERTSYHHVIVDEELRSDCAKLLEDKETYIDAIRRAGVVLEERLRKTLGGGEQGKYGVDLVDDAMKRSFGKLIISDHPAEQDGVHMLFRGAVQFVRNPPAHKKVQYSELEARQTISLIDYLLLLLRQAKPKGTK